MNQIKSLAQFSTIAMLLVVVVGGDSGENAHICKKLYFSTEDAH